MRGRAPTVEPPYERALWSATSPRPDIPLLLAGHRSAAILSGTSDLELTWETRGAPVEWGGTYAQGVRLTGPWRVTLGPTSGRPLPLAATLRGLEARRHEVVSAHAGEGWTARQEIVVPHDDPAVTRRITVTALAERGIDLTLGMSVEPFLLPVLMEGLRPPRHHLAATATGFTIAAEGYAAELLASRAPDGMAADGQPVPAGGAELPLRQVQLAWRLHLDPAETVRLNWVLWGGLERLLRTEPDQGARILACAPTWREDRRASQAAWWAERPVLSFPQDPALEEGARLAMGALEALAHAPQMGMVGLVAGYPWYCALWFRDIAWMLPALLWLGDLEWTKATLQTVLRFQSRAHIPILGAEKGELPMQVSPGPIFLYGTSDTTLHYPGLAARYLHHGGPERSGFLRELLPALHECLTWADRKVNPVTGLFANGGEIAEMAEAAAHGRVQYGFEARDTTIWDSTDRRAHAIDLQVLHARALRGMAELASVLASGYPPPSGLPVPGPAPPPRGPLPPSDPSLAGTLDASGLRARADGIQRTVLDRYAWPEEGYLVDTLSAQGEPVRKLRPNALLTLMDGWLPDERAAAALRRVARDDMTTAWGVRTLSRLDPTFDPEAYHDGQVWTIATGWAAHAALVAGAVEQGMGYLRTIAGLLQQEHGLANECYHGLRPAPFNSCFLLGLSIGPFLTALFEGLWGLRVDATLARLTVAPAFPASYQEARLEGLRVGGSRLDLVWKAGTLQATWREGPPVTLVAPSGQAVRLSDPTPRTLPVPRRAAPPS